MKEKRSALPKKIKNLLGGMGSARWTEAVDGAGKKLNAGDQGNGCYFIRKFEEKAILKFMHVPHKRPVLRVWRPQKKSRKKAIKYV